MTRKFRRWHAFALATLLVLTMASCDIPENPTVPKDPTEPSVPVVTDPIGISTEPSDTPSFPGMIGASANINVEQVRMSGYHENWISRFTNQIGEYVIVESEQALEDALDRIRALDKSFDVSGNYDAAFFLEHYLVLLPAQSTSGSLRYELEATQENQTITLDVSGIFNGIGTSDMADWLLIAVLPRADYSVDAEIVIKAGGGKYPDQGLDIYDQ